MLGVILIRIAGIFLMDEIAENIFHEELDKLLFVKIQFREKFSEWVQDEIQNLK